MSAPRSLKHEYELFVEREIELYKDTISRTALLSIGDEAVARLREQAQTTLTEMVLWEEVDRIISRRLRLPSYRVWRQRRLKILAEYRRPEHWGLAPTSALARELAQSDGSHVLVAGVDGEGAAMYSAAHGCAVTALAHEPDAVERVMHAAEVAGLSERVRGCVGDLAQWAPDVALRVVVCTPTAFEHLTPSERAAAIELLQSATLDGGVHLVSTLVAGSAALSVEELRARYDGWAVSVERDGGGAASALGTTFLARKSALAQ
ncbi:hypothetical protein J421_2615 [Gemmatirosa kalamazoonensis]|uniref:SAM-dependent methyltransferase n=1 Tax=Gemmatirosa kalamazoonensis TaxID=861299 RepID=W0RIA4_9BACT|nr:hypothetical protein [Gemmatirosa kalamazoonensis]AHG90152.1 hypothetical protein J421_2615 [Gemmatirosa kalamazoonensis]